MDSQAVGSEHPQIDTASFQRVAEGLVATLDGEEIFLPGGFVQVATEENGDVVAHIKAWFKVNTVDVINFENGS